MLGHFFGMNMDFNVLVSDDFLNICTNNKIKIKDNKKIVTFINDFEDRKWRSSKFFNFIWNNIAETALNHKEREALFDKSREKLIESAKKLRLSEPTDTIGRGSEIAEIMLYAIMKHHYGALPVVPKIYYKQNSQDNAKGADSVHIIVDGDNYSLWFGEAKFFSNLSDQNFYQITNSLSEALKTEKLKKENSIITGLSDLNGLGIENELLDKIIKDLSPKNSIDNIKKLINVPIMIIHGCEITEETSLFDEDYIFKMKTHYFEKANKYFLSQYNKLKEVPFYDLIKFHLILFPVPNKDKIVDRFIKNVEHYKAEAED